jgi:hypothetical protein
MVRGLLTRLAKGCIQRLCRRQQPKVANIPALCKIVTLSSLDKKWMMAVVRQVGSFLVPRKVQLRDWKVVESSGTGSAALQCTSLPHGPVYPTDFGLLHVMVEREGGLKVLFTAKDDLSSLLQQ